MSDPLEGAPSVDDEPSRVVLWLPDGRALRRPVGFQGPANRSEPVMSKQNQTTMRKQDGMKMPKGMPMPMKGGKGGGKKGC